MTDLEDAEAREHAAAVMHFRLEQAFDRGEPVACLMQHAYAEWRAAERDLAGAAFAEFLGRVVS